LRIEKNCYGKKIHQDGSSNGTKATRHKGGPRAKAECEVSQILSCTYFQRSTSLTSSSILLISHLNQILLLHRVKTSSAFPSAHVFPGGNLSASQDGTIPGPKDPARHIDGPAYRLGAIRECFEESGILLARNKQGGMLEISDQERERARKEIHAGRLRFVEWVEDMGGVVDSGL
jgi:8-oxo-dGTP pyrophosphatase MutT (NUDIX family)